MIFDYADGFRWNDADGIYEIIKDPDATVQYRLRWHDWLRGDDRYWLPKTFFVPGETATPPREGINGHRYRCTVGGRTAGTQPSWSTSGTATFTDGSVTWARIGAEDRIATNDFTAETGITVSAESIDATECVTLVTLTGGTLGRSYIVTDSITTDAGLTENQRFRVLVRQH